MILPDDYLRAVAEAVHAVGGLFVLDCIASGAIWVDMQATGVDVLVSAPQKGWSGSPCCALVMLGERARAAHRRHHQHQLRLRPEEVAADHGDLRGRRPRLPRHHADRRADGVRDVMLETRAYGFDKLRQEQIDLGRKVRALLAAHGFPSVAAPGFEAPGVVVSYTDDAGIQTGKAFAAQGLQTAAGVPLLCDEPEDFKTFRIGLFGLDKLHNVERTVANLETALDKILGKTSGGRAAA